MSTLEEKILGEKLQYYCSSSSSENEGDDSDNSDREYEDASEGVYGTVTPMGAQGKTASYLASPYSQWDGTSSNTGPKGVIKDWQRYKQLEAEKRVEQERERLQLVKKFSLTCRSTFDDEKERLAQADPDLAELLADDFLLEYQKQRMKEMLAKAQKLRFGTLINLTSADEFLVAVDGEDHSVTVIVHIYETNVPGCEPMNGSLISLAGEYPFVKFCKILGSVAGLSKRFKKVGVPALLVYKKGQVIGNFVRMTENLGIDFYASDVEAFLIERGMLSDRRCVPTIISQDRSSDNE